MEMYGEDRRFFGKISKHIDISCAAYRPERAVTSPRSVRINLYAFGVDPRLDTNVSIESMITLSDPGGTTKFYTSLKIIHIRRAILY